MTGSDEQARFRYEGYVAVRSLLSQRDIEAARAALQSLFQRHSDLSPKHVCELGPAGPDPSSATPVQILRPTSLQPALRRTAVYRVCRSLASRLLGTRCAYVFDHSVKKPAHSQASLDWHQDEAYLPAGLRLHTVNIWVPLGDARLDGGCLAYAPGSHRGGLRTHEREGRTLRAAGTVSSAARVCPVTAGDVVAHHPLTLHRALPNRHHEELLAWTLHFGPGGRLAYYSPSNLRSHLCARWLGCCEHTNGPARRVGSGPGESSFPAGETR